METTASDYLKKEDAEQDLEEYTESRLKKHKKHKKHKAGKKKRKERDNTDEDQAPEQDKNTEEQSSKRIKSEIKKEKRKKVIKLEENGSGTSSGDAYECSFCIDTEHAGTHNTDSCPHRSPKDEPSISVQEEMDQEFNFDEDLHKYNANLDLDLQYAVVTKMFKGKLITDICREYGLSQEVVNEIWEKRENILDVSHSGKMDKQSYKELDTKLIEWYNERKARNEPVTGKMMIDKADEIAIDCGHVAFNSTTKWIDRFKKRHNISLRSIPHKREPYNGGCKAKDTFILEQWPELRVGFTDEDIFTADEIGVFFNTSNGRIQRKMGKKYIHGHAKDRLAIFMCTNMTGNEKKKLLVCGVEDPLQGTSRPEYSLPVRYIRNKNGHFTTATFEDEIRKWDAQLERDNRRALLILDRASIHTKMLTLNLKLVFVPWKASTVLMPIKNGIASVFREEFRKLMLLSKVQNVMRGIDRTLTCLEGLEMLAKAWSRINNDVIMKSFFAAGFEAINKYPITNTAVISPSYTHNDQSLMCKWLVDFDVEKHFTDPLKLESYLTVDEELLTDQGTHSSVFGGNRRAKEIVYPETSVDEELQPIGTDRPTDLDKEALLMKIRALHDLEVTRQYLEYADTSYDIFNSFAEIEKFLVRNPVRSTLKEERTDKT